MSAPRRRHLLQPRAGGQQHVSGVQTAQEHDVRATHAQAVAADEEETETETENGRAQKAAQ